MTISISRISVFILFTIFVKVAEAQSQSPARMVTCNDPNWPYCYDLHNFICPPCANCVMDCEKCQPVCIPPPPPPPDAGRSPVEAVCDSEEFPFCYMSRHMCPFECPHQCEVDCLTCKPVCGCSRPGSVCQDPKFVGADGVTFYFHGKKDRDFCIVSDPDLHINAHFIGKRNDNMTRDFTWVQSLGILFGKHKLVVGAMKTATWYDYLDRLSFSFDQQKVNLPTGKGQLWSPDNVSDVRITRTSETNSVVIEVDGKFKINVRVVPITEKESRVHNYGVTEEDCFAHLDLGFKFYSLSGEVNGVLGQTYASNYVSRVKMGVEMPVLGGEKEFSSSDLLSTDCSVSQFNRLLGPSITTEYANLDCSSGIQGNRIVCKR